MERIMDTDTISQHYGEQWEVLCPKIIQLAKAHDLKELTGFSSDFVTGKSNIRHVYQ